MKPDTVIFFDAGGTLIHPVRPVGQLYAEAARDFGVEADAERLHRGFLRTWKSLKPRDPVEGARVTDDRGWWKEVVRGSWDDQPPPEDFEAYFELVYRNFAKPEWWVAYPEVESVLAGIKIRGYRCAVLSNWDRRLRQILAGFSWSSHFEELVISSEVGAEKPHPVIFREAERRLGIGSGQAVLWGDDADCDGAGAREAGWRLGLVDRPGRGLVHLLEELTSSIGG